MSFPKPLWLSLLAQVYNWVKYKSLPPSVNQRSRLYIERENKHRRVVMNLGLTFRNSKWSDYRRSNLGFNFLKTGRVILQTTLGLLLCVLLVWYAPNLFLSLNLTHNVFTNVWFVFDSALYTKLALVATWLVSAQSWLTWFGAQMAREFGLHYTKEKGYFLGGDFGSANCRVIYSWSIHLSGPNLFTLEAVAGRNGRVHSVALGQMSLSKNIYVMFGMATPVLGAAKPASDEYIVLGAPELPTASDEPRRRKYQEVVGAASAALPAPASYTAKSAPRGLFVLPVDNFTTLARWESQFAELTGLAEATLRQVNSAKWSRWLYKYSLLHRKSVFQSHSNTLTKKLLSSGYYDSSLFDSNVHSTSLVGSLLSPSTFFKKSFYDSYANFLASTSGHFSSTLPQSRWLNVDKAHQLSFLESSYFWTLKRLYLFNTLPNASRVSQLKSSQPKIQAESVSGNLGISGARKALTSLTASRFGDSLSSVSSLNVISSESALVQRRVANPLSYVPDYSLYDYDFTEFVVTILSNKASTTRSSYYYSPLFSDKSVWEGKSKIKGL